MSTLFVGDSLFKYLQVDNADVRSFGGGKTEDLLPSMRDVSDFDISKVAVTGSVARFHTTRVTIKQEDCSRFPIPSLESLPEDLKDRLTEVADKSGFMPNVFRGLSYQPDELRAFNNYYDVVMAERGNLTKADKEMIVVATSAENQCLYCVIAHGALHRIFSKNPMLADQLAANWRTADIDDRQRAILEFAIDLCHCKPLTEDRFTALYDQGLTQEDAWDIGAVTAFFALSNRMAFLMNLKPNKEFYLMGRIKKEKK